MKLLNHEIGLCTPPREGFQMIPSTCPNTHMDGLFGDANVTYKQSIQFTFTSLNEVHIIKSYIEATQALHSYCS